MELVHHHIQDRAVLALVQGDVGENLGGAAQDGRAVVHRGVAGGKPYVLGAKFAAEGHPLLVHQRLDGAGVDAAAPLGKRLEMQRRGHQRFSRSCRCVQDDVLAVPEFQDGLFLGRIEREAAGGVHFEKTRQKVIIRARLPARKGVGKVG